MTLGEKIKYYRKNENLSQENLAEKVGVSRQAVTKWESNKSSPSTENLIIISEVLDVSIKDLTSNTPIPRKNKSNKIGIRDKRFYNSFFDEEKIICERKYDFYSLIIGLFIIIPSVVLFHDLTNGFGTGGMTFMELAKLSFAGKGVILLVRNILIFGLMISFVIKSYLSKEEKYKLVNKKN
ncbi:helix-turn-helix domain-containing protein [Wansuia hejianensis]|uniref:Helix-turn-helix transcriptional regulator n=1 Tax=Wansuia hejianensis TaxID=2763667 RepID=A0A926IN07_9FIRM|nr:helix-turn-helix transcriptional regulator [Wansuia hejianensis]MBC8591166.1 helix-turn-helix transcriptional regulator [Wansuia hejianensis]